jgi:hypothetical protein
VSIFFKAWSFSYIAHNHIGSYFAACQLLGTCTECNDERNDLYAGGLDVYDTKFEMLVFQSNLLGGLPALTLVVLQGKT